MARYDRGPACVSGWPGHAGIPTTLTFNRAEAGRDGRPPAFAAEPLEGLAGAAAHLVVGERQLRDSAEVLKGSAVAGGRVDAYLLSTRSPTSPTGTSAPLVASPVRRGCGTPS